MYNKVVSSSKTLSKGTHHYDSMMTSNGVLTNVANVLSKRNEKVHNEAYQKAKDNYLSKNPSYKDYTWVEIRSENWFDPSKAILIMPTYPFTKKKIDLKDYWPVMEDTNFRDNWKDMILVDTVPYDYEITYIDYISGKAKIENRINGDIQWVDFDKLSQDMNVSENYSLDDTFSKKYNDI